MKKLTAILLLLCIGLFNIGFATETETPTPAPSDAVEDNAIHFDIETANKAESTALFVIECFANERYDAIFELCSLELVAALGGYQESFEIFWTNLVEQYGAFVDLLSASFQPMDDVNMLGSFVLSFEKAEVTIGVIIGSGNELVNVQAMSVHLLEEDATPEE